LEKTKVTEFLQNYWFWIVSWILLLFFAGMHAFGGGCGMGHGEPRKKSSSDDSNPGEGKSCH